MADWGGQGARLVEALSCGDGIVWGWKFVFAEQYAGAISWAAVSSDEHPRQCGSSASAAYGGTENHALARDCGIFDGRAAGVSVGGQLSNFCGSHRGDLRNGEDLRAWNRPAGR